MGVVKKRVTNIDNVKYTKKVFFYSLVLLPLSVVVYFIVMWINDGTDNGAFLFLKFARFLMYGSFVFVGLCGLLCLCESLMYSRKGKKIGKGGESGYEKNSQEID